MRAGLFYAHMLYAPNVGSSTHIYAAWTKINVCTEEGSAFLETWACFDIEMYEYAWEVNRGEASLYF